MLRACRSRSRAPPALNAPVNDYAKVIDAASAAELERRIRALQAATGDVVVVATVPTFQPYGDIREFAGKMFQNGGRGVGDKGKDNGLLIVVAVQDRRVDVEVGYALEEFITDGFAGETIRERHHPRVPPGQLRRRPARGRHPHHQPDRRKTRRHPAGRAARPARRAAARRAFRSA